MQDLLLFFDLETHDHHAAGGELVVEDYSPPFLQFEGVRGVELALDRSLRDDCNGHHIRLSLDMGTVDLDSPRRFRRNGLGFVESASQASTTDCHRAVVSAGNAALYSSNAMSWSSRSGTAFLIFFRRDIAKRKHYQ